MRKIVVLCAVSVLTSWATVIHVPAEQPTIQAGLNAAGYGDTVLVADSSYYENLTWPSTDGIYLTSEHGPEVTIIDGGSARVVSFSGSHTRATCLHGFTVRGGKAHTGAGIYVGSGSPSIIGNIIRGNACQGGSNYGAGIYVGNRCLPLVQANYITENLCSDSSTWNYGAGIYVDMDARPEISYNLITRNTCSGGYWNYGAGVYCALRSQPVIFANTVTDNTCTLGQRGHGAGICVDMQSTPLILCNLITGNTCSSVLWNYGAGIRCEATGSIINNTIVGNNIVGGNWRNGGGIYMDSQAVVKNNIITGNSAGSGGGIFNSRGQATEIACNDVWNNTGGNYQGCSPGPGDISQDPLFVTGPLGGYYLSQTAAGQPTQSPCVDAGASGILPESLEYYLETSTTRTDSVYDALPFDMGFHYPRVAMTGISAPGLKPQDPGPQFLASPNPFRGTVRFTCRCATPGRLTIYTAAGRRVREFSFSSGVGVLTWNAQGLAPGAYFYRLIAGNESFGGRIVKVR